MDKLIEPFEAVCGDPYAAARTVAQEGRPVAGCLSNYTPLELLHAAGYLPVRVQGSTGSTQHADAHAQNFACSVSRSALELALSGELDFLSVTVFSHRCDTMQNLADIWRKNVPSTPVFTVAIPTVLGTNASLVFCRGELERLRHFLETQRGPIDDAVLEQSIQCYENQRGLMRQVYAARRGRPGIVSGRQVHSVAQAALFMPVENHVALLADLVDGIEAPPALESAPAPGMFLVGSVCQDGEYISAIEAAGSRIAGDDFYTGERAVDMTLGSEGDPLDRLARMYLDVDPCPTKHRPGFDAGARLVEKVRASGAAGVVFLQTKLCDPWAFDHPYAKNALDEAGVPSLLVEIEQHQAPSEQFKTRVAAFAELVAARDGGAANS